MVSDNDSGKEDQLVSSAQVKLVKYRNVLKESKFFQESQDILGQLSIKYIRCLALGSPIDMTNAMYQLAYILEIMDILSIPTKNLSLYDPIFNTNDEKFLIDIVNSTIDEQIPTHFAPESTLYFLPHAPIELMETLLDTEFPIYVLGNDVVSHTDGFTKRKLFEKYPKVSKLLNQISSPIKLQQEPKQDEVPFQTPKSRSRKNRNKFVEPVIDYTTVPVYFSGCKIVRFKQSVSKDAVWGNAFSDLAYHLISE
ncbi:SRR1-domain-containing protein [Scheffersomyces amazonensis]|uniref:SRR1-domain-containing protein n=1 Tax=Scheffersomyces amazonensis TaxID=1078765 RepID=UPI00315C9E51